jgi:hypothetical protein
LPQWLAATVVPQLYSYALLHQPGEKLSGGMPRFNWMTSLNMTIGVVGIVIEYEIGGVSVSPNADRRLRRWPTDRAGARDPVPLIRQPLMNARRSALIVSASVVIIPWGKPL